MWFWSVVFFIIFIVLIIDESGFFPYYSFFDNDGTFKIKKNLLFTSTLNLENVISASVNLRNINNPISVIELRTKEKTIPIRVAGLFGYKSNIKILDEIKKANPKIDMENAKLKKYIEAKQKKGFYVVDEHLNGYIFLIISLLFFGYFTYRALFG